MENLDLKENKHGNWIAFKFLAQCGQDGSKLYCIYNLAEIKRLFLAGKTRCDMHRDFSPKWFYKEIVSCYSPFLAKSRYINASKLDSLPGWKVRYYDTLGRCYTHDVPDWIKNQQILDIVMEFSRSAVIYFHHNGQLLSHDSDQKIVVPIGQKLFLDIRHELIVAFPKILKNDYGIEHFTCSEKFDETYDECITTVSTNIRDFCLNCKPILTSWVKIRC